MKMSEWNDTSAPDLGRPTDTPVGEDAAAAAASSAADSDAEQTMDTPDELGGTGAEQAGGAG